MSLTPEDLAAAAETITGRELAPPTFFRYGYAFGIRSVAVA
jgi:hypothetical protein